MLDATITARIAAAKRRLLDGGLLREIEWGVPGEPDGRGRRIFTYTMLDALIEERPALDRSTIDTDRADDTLVYIFDAVAVEDSHVFRYGDPPHTHQIKEIDGLIQNEESGTRYFSQVVLIR